MQTAAQSLVGSIAMAPAIKKLFELKIEERICAELESNIKPASHLLLAVVSAIA